MPRVRASYRDRLDVDQAATADLFSVVIVDHQLRAEEHARGDEHDRQNDQNP